MTAWFRVFLVLLLLLSSTIALADTQLRSHSDWQFKAESVEAVWTISVLDSAKLLSLGTNDIDRLASSLMIFIDTHGQVTQQQNSCRLADWQSLPAAAAQLRLQLQYNCHNSESPVTINLQSFFQQSPQHVHFARIHLPVAADSEQLLTVQHAHFTVALTGDNEVANITKPSSYAVFSNYLQFGFQHILAGYDHLAFLAALMLLVARWRDLLLLVTGFTVGHSFTLVATSLSWLAVDNDWVEVMIGFSIALVAAEVIVLKGARAGRIAASAVILMAALIIANWGQLTAVLSLLGLAIFTCCYLQFSISQLLRWRIIITLVFGMVHGFGFASVLNEVGLPQANLIAGLLAFNLGVELGQLTVALLLIAFVFLIKKIRPVEAYDFQPVAASILCGVGLYWFVGRSLSLL